MGRQIAISLLHKVGRTAAQVLVLLAKRGRVEDEVNPTGQESTVIARRVVLETPYSPR